MWKAFEFHLSHFEILQFHYTKDGAQSALLFCLLGPLLIGLLADAADPSTTFFHHNRLDCRKEKSFCNLIFLSFSVFSMTTCLVILLSTRGVWIFTNSWVRYNFFVSMAKLFKSQQLLKCCIYLIQLFLKLKIKKSDSYPDIFHESYFSLTWNQFRSNFCFLLRFITCKLFKFPKSTIFGNFIYKGTWTS